MNMFIMIIIIRMISLYDSNGKFNNNNNNNDNNNNTATQYERKMMNITTMKWKRSSGPSLSTKISKPLNELLTIQNNLYHDHIYDYLFVRPISLLTLWISEGLIQAEY